MKKRTAIGRTAGNPATPPRESTSERRKPKQAARSRTIDKPAVLSRGNRLQATLLKAVLDDVLASGFRAVTVESISAKTGIAKTTIYRRWPNKSAMVMDAFLQRIGPRVPFLERGSPVESIRLQMLALAKVFRGPYGGLAKALLGEAQFDAELAAAFRDRWIVPRREVAKESLRTAIQHRELRADLDLDETLDALYGGLYYRLMIGSGPITNAYTQGIFSRVMDGLRPPAGPGRSRPIAAKQRHQKGKVQT